MPDLVHARDQIVDSLVELELNDHELRVVTERTKVNPPCAYVAFGGIPEVYLGGNVEALIHVYLVANATDETRSLEELAQLFELVEPRIPIGGEVEFVGLSVPEHSTPLPALRIPTTVTTL